MEKILSTITDCRGNETPVAILSQIGGQLYLWEINCLSSSAHGLGNCLCANHQPTTETPVSTAEVISRFGVEALDGFEEPGVEQLVFDTFGVEIDELETFLRVSYSLGANPLPVLRKKTKAPVVFSENSELLTFPEEEPGTTIFVINSHGYLSVKINQ